MPMNSIFPMDDFSELLWQGPMPASAMIRSPSDWEFEKFLEEFPATASSSASDTVVSQSPTSSKPHICDDDVLEIERHEIPPLLVPPPRQPSDRAPLASTDSDGYCAFLKSQLDLACAAAAKSRESIVKPEVVSSVVEDQRTAAKNFQSESQVSGNVHGISEMQSEADGASLHLPALPSMQQKQEVPVQQTTSGSSREDSDDDELEGDTENNELLEPADEKRARRMQSNRESARRSRRRKQAQLHELEAQVGQLRDECTSLVTRLTDINKKCDEASVDNRILNANIETLRTKVKMAEDQVKRVTGLNPMLLARSNLPSMGMQFVAGQTDASTNVAVPMQPNNNHFFHRSAPNITSGAPHIQRLNNGCPNNNIPLATNPQADTGTTKIGVMASMQPFAANGQNMADLPPIQHVQKSNGLMVNPSGDLPACNKGLSQPVAKDNKKK